MDTEWCYLPDRCEVMVDVAGIYDQHELEKILSEIGEQFTWTGVQFVTEPCEDELGEWMYLLGATTRSNDSNKTTGSAGDGGVPTQ